MCETLVVTLVGLLEMFAAGGGIMCIRCMNHPCCSQFLL